AVRSQSVEPGQVLLFSTVRNETSRLPYFFEHYRRLGVGHFFIVDNGSTDGTAAFLAEQSDVSFWTTAASYKLARFGMDWLTSLQIRHGHGHWCLTVDADELFIYPFHETRSLGDLTAWLERNGQCTLGALMLDLYPRGRLSEKTYIPGQDPTEILQWFDRGNYQQKYQRDLRNQLVRGGVRSRVFFAADPARAPTLSKIPLVKWNRRYVYVSSTHSMLPTRLNGVRGEDVAQQTSGILLHTKFLHMVIEKAREDQHRRQHFENGELFRAYYDGLIADPDFWTPSSEKYAGWRQLEDLGLMSRGGWDEDPGAAE
ncbi:MAG TPA: glycosyltransferase family 2 protein, partial [Rhodobacteraceae bacterium]|nr:glycosyltransferase family 2 protein [Paracoccaceae bacterium]